ncbi:MAG TPA: ribonuclease T [Erythrobacter sp.]|nr:ribonuclease T [Erythrobacter sp.]
MPQSVSVPQVAPEAPERRLPVTGYTLALRWSPEFCKAREMDARQRLQCSGRNGRFGLVVHGLWPEGHGTWPQWCRTALPVSPAEARRNLCMMPSPALMARQWAKHGSCMAARPEPYFRITRVLWESLRLPDYDRLSRQDGLTAGDIRRAFSDANGRHWQPEMVGVKLNARGWLEELRLCYGKDFMPAECDRARHSSKDSTPAKIWRGLSGKSGIGWGADCQILARKRLKLPFAIPDPRWRFRWFAFLTGLFPGGLRSEVATVLAWNVVDRFRPARAALYPKEARGSRQSAGQP